MNANEILSEFHLVDLSDPSGEEGRQWVAKKLLEKGEKEAAEKFLNITWERAYENGMWNLPTAEIKKALETVLSSN